MRYMEKRFDEMRKKAGTKIMEAGILIRIIILVALIGGCYFVCERTTEESAKYYQKQNERGY